MCEFTGFKASIPSGTGRRVAALCLALGVAFSPLAGAEESAESESVQPSASVRALEQIIETPLSIRESRRQAQQAVNDLSRDIQGLKTSVIDLNRDLRVLEEDLLFPANTRLSVFVSLDVGEFFQLEGVELKVDGQTVTSYLYNEAEREALAKGGMHRLHLGNVGAGDHTVSAFFVGLGPNGREYKRGTTLDFTKSAGPKYIELSIADSEARQQPEFSIREW
ncbi:hypothetical protein [Marinobacter zhejiangensis]|uniref:AraC family transcriptional regulator n=1 Tax=Marinobacter zhejiangensis TaxID=488535 RepID=A0A1I4KX94_9GAMM|nr:hypothetical protein [Marinobacter zhejiangensis]SFL83424.1 hypothetical protein SAMN04487963_0139 [Marinobacter zhejiangensis]